MSIRKCMGVAALTAATVLSGCASIVGDSRYPVAVSSVPPGVSFDILDKDGKLVHSGSTPSTVTLKSGRGYFKGQTYTLQFRKDGYTEKSVTLDSGLSGWYWGNILIGGLVGMLIVDPLTGAMYKLPEGVSADMGSPLTAGRAQGDLNIVMLDAVPVAQRAQLVRVN
ncbi:hypothetical protein EXN22_11610 [Pseudomonas tructae]|uniref:PEGA domain-containing protein n=1 Tax=Pseudomonas tructae TaxID=2518644 RepID=A0A411MHM7_9PSED|nr:hypothetical protein [Pseudomonas tructae]QBF26307.1 hypothetical protein EXN22_11610 [Pseudomonas tructae]